MRSFTGYSFGAGAYASLRDNGAGSGATSFAGDVTSETSSMGKDGGSGMVSEKSSADVDTPMLGVVGVSSPAVGVAS